MALSCSDNKYISDTVPTSNLFVLNLPTETPELCLFFCIVLFLFILAYNTVFEQYGARFQLHWGKFHVYSMIAKNCIQQGVTKSCEPPAEQE